MNPRDLPHDRRCPTLRGADPDLCRCDEDGAYDVQSRSSTARPDADARPPWRVQTIAMSKLWSAARVTRRPDRLVLTGVLLGRPTPESSRELTVGDADNVLRQLRELEAASQLQAWAADTLAALASAESGGGRS